MLLWLLATLVLVLALLPALGGWLGLLALDTPFRWLAVPMAVQLDLSDWMFGHLLFVRTEEAGDLPAGWLAFAVTIAIWFVIAVVLWALIRQLAAFKRLLSR